MSLVHSARTCAATDAALWSVAFAGPLQCMHAGRRWNLGRDHGLWWICFRCVTCKYDPKTSIVKRFSQNTSQCSLFAGCVTQTKLCCSLVVPAKAKTGQC